LCLLACTARAQAAGCAAPFPVAYRTLSFADGREISVWYPASTQPSASSCGRWPIVLFSHGVAGCGTQAVFITEQIARSGYVVVAPNHHDALCGKPVEARPWNHGDATEPPFLEPERWDERAHRDRLTDLREALRLVAEDPLLARESDATRIGLMGHSLGGYTVLGVAGAWPGWRLPGVRAVLAFSPFVEPFLAHARLRALRVPVMYQGGTLDFTITPSVAREVGAYAQSPAPKYFVDLSGASHLAWTNWLCKDEDAVAACLADTPNARLIDAYAIAFLDRYVKGLPAPLLSAPGKRLARWRAAP
jgi:predicted dienelactone hydrolase